MNLTDSPPTRQIHGAGRALVSIHGIGLFTHTDIISTSGTWTVPDLYEDGSTVEVQIECLGAGGGGGAGRNYPHLPGQLIIPLRGNGGPGGAGGRAVSFKSFLPGTVLTVTVGAGGAAAVADNTFGGVGGDTFVTDANNPLVQANGGKGGAPPVFPETVGIGGPAGGGIGEYVYVGQGAAGGMGGSPLFPTSPSTAQPGQNGSVNIYW